MAPRWPQDGEDEYDRSLMMKDTASRTKLCKKTGKQMIFKDLRVREGVSDAAASAGLDPGGTFLEGFMSGSSTVLAAPDGVRPD